LLIVDESQHNRFAAPLKVAYNDHHQGDHQQLKELLRQIQRHKTKHLAPSAPLLLCVKVLEKTGFKP
jgi:hypothetical protein